MGHLSKRFAVAIGFLATTLSTPASAGAGFTSGDVDSFYFHYDKRKDQNLSRWSLKAHSLDKDILLDHASNLKSIMMTDKTAHEVRISQSHFNNFDLRNGLVEHLTISESTFDHLGMAKFSNQETFDIENSSFKTADFSASVLTQPHFINVDLGKANFKGATLWLPQLVNVKGQINLEGAHLQLDTEEDCSKLLRLMAPAAQTTLAKLDAAYKAQKLSPWDAGKVNLFHRTNIEAILKKGKKADQYDDLYCESFVQKFYASQHAIEKLISKGAQGQPTDADVQPTRKNGDRH